MLEEVVVKLIVNSKPDTIVDCDNGGELFISKNFVKNLFVKKINCNEYINRK